MSLKYYFLMHSIVCVFSKPAQILHENDPCTTANTRPGICIQMEKCPEALNQVNHHDHHDLIRCGFVNSTEIVCCPKPRKHAQYCRQHHNPDGKNPTKSKLEDDGGIFIAGGEAVVFLAALNGSKGFYEFPYVGAIGYYDPDKKEYEFKCAGTIISERYLVTAAHCLWTLSNEEPKIVKTGQPDVPKRLTRGRAFGSKTIKNCIVHPKYSFVKKNNDIALIELNHDLEFFFNVKPACLFDDDVNYPENFTIAGWGATEFADSKVRLQKANISLVPFDHCKKKWENYGKPISKAQLCASSNRSDTCEGDSGGPMMVTNSTIPLLVGVTSFGDPICGGGKASVYTSVSQYIDWIEEHVWEPVPRDPVVLGEFPFLVAVTNVWYSRGQPFIKMSCQGTIISETYVLTASSWIYSSEKYSIRPGRLDIPQVNAYFEPKVDILVKNTIKHPKYDDRAKINNIVLLQLESPIPFGPNVQKARLATHGSFGRHQKFTIANWVTANVNPDEFRHLSEFEGLVYVLKKSHVQYEPFRRCKKKYEAEVALDDTHLCARHNRSDVWEGNFGGPLLMHDSDGFVVVGINAFIEPGCFRGSTHVYTNIAKYTAWISEVVEGNKTQQSQK